MRNDDSNNPNSQDAEATMACERVLELVPTFVDGESSESLSSAVRKHLIDCAECRVLVQEEKGLRQWFEPVAGEAGRADVEVPEGFAARVTAMAFAGSSATGSLEAPMHVVGSHEQRGSQERRGPRLLRSLDAGSSQAGSLQAGSSGTAARAERSSLGFVISMTAAAAALMVSFTLMLAQDRRHDVGGAPLSADAPLEETLRDLEALNDVETLAMERTSADEVKLDPADESATDASPANVEGLEGSPKDSQ
ncbi:MAG: hypothetical protein ACJA2W_002757 [Planctomycetota bacterium]|jgi:hypothetical protein